MPRVQPLLAAFNAGELSPLMEGRADFNKYPHGCRTLINWLPLVHGGVLKRSGTRFGASVRNPSLATRLVPFEFSTVQAYVLEFGNLYFRIHKDGAPVVDTAVTITGATAALPVKITAVNTYSNGDRIIIQGVAGMTELNNREFEVTNVTGADFDLLATDGLLYTAYSAGGTAEKVIQFTTPYTTADLAGLQWAQSADVLYLAHKSHPPQKISRTSHTAWTRTPIAFDWPPFIEENKTTTTVYSSAATGAATITASAAIFAASDVGRIFKLAVVPESKYNLWVAGTVYGAAAYVRYEGNVYQTAAGGTAGTSPPIHRKVGQIELDGVVAWTYVHSGVGSIEITGYVNTTTVTGTVINEIPNVIVGAPPTYPTRKWAFGAWDATNGYPTTVTFFQDRLWWAGSSAEPQTFWASRPGDFEDHEVTDDDEGAMSFTLNSDKVNAIKWMKAKKNLVLGTAGAEWPIISTGQNEALTAATISAQEHTTEGSRTDVRPIAINEEILFAQKAGRRLNSLRFDFDSEQYAATDRTLLSEHIAIGRFKELAYQQEPYRLIWAVLEDGQLISLTYDRPQDVIAWHRHVLGGDDVFVESVAVIPRSDGEGDQLYLIVRRTIDGGTKRYVEYMEREWRRTDDVEDAVFVDSSLEYDGAPATTFSGLWHLNGQSVDVLADGFVLSPETVADGKITVTDAASKVQIGLHFMSSLETMKLEGGAPDGTAQGRLSRIDTIALRLDQTGAGLFYGPDLTNMDELFLRGPSALFDTPLPLFTGDTTRLAWKGGSQRGERVALEHRLPLPCTILAAMPQFRIEEK